MTGWSGYRPGDLVPFSSDAYWRLFMAENVVLWPLPVVAAIAGGMLLFRLTLQSRPVPGFPVMLLLAGVWIWVGWNFVLHRYGTLNWAGSWLVWLFLLQGALLCIHANRIDLQPAAGLRGRLGAAIALFGLWGYPLLAPLNGRSLLLGEAFASRPGPDGRDDNRRPCPGGAAQPRPADRAGTVAGRLVHDPRCHRRDAGLADGRCGCGRADRGRVATDPVPGYAASARMTSVTARRASRSSSSRSRKRPAAVTTGPGPSACNRPLRRLRSQA